MTEYLILVDETDSPCGKMEKLEVHQRGLLHRAFSVFVLNSKGELLLQQRASEKYHSGGLWTNTCCSHPRFGEETTDAVNRRLSEEMGMRCNTTFAFSFLYKVQFENGLTENEFDHVYIGFNDAEPIPDPAEVQQWKYMNLDELETDLKQYPERYTEWFKICFPIFKTHTVTIQVQS